MLVFKNKPDTSTPINATNLNANFEELNTNIDNTGDKIGDLNDLETTDKTSVVDAINELNDDIIYVEYTQNYSIDAGAGTRSRVTFQTSVPAGYNWVGYEIVSNGYVNSVINWIMSSTASNCLVAWYNLSDETYDNLTMTIRGIYKKI